jgi:hypothetical protein
MKLSALIAVGSVSVGDLTAISDYYGRDFIPFPFMQTLNSPLSPEEVAMHDMSVIDRFKNGEMREVQDWAMSYVRCDIRVEAHVQFLASDKTSVRVVAHRTGSKGYFAQQTEDDVVEIFSLSPYEIGEAVATSMALSKPGCHDAVMIPEYQVRQGNQDESSEVSIKAALHTGDAIAKVSRQDLDAIASVQSHWRPVRRWGVDRRKPAVFWVRPKGDGDYVFSSDYSLARPLSQPQLVTQINRLIAADIARLREFRDHEGDPIGGPVAMRLGVGGS